MNRPPSDDLRDAQPDTLGPAKNTLPARADETALQMQAIMNNAPVGIAFSRDRRITRYNARFAEMFGFAGDAGIGQPTLTLYPSQKTYDETSALAYPLLSRGKPWQREMPMRRQDGSVFWAHAIAYVTNPDNTSEGTIWIIDDRSERQAAEESLKKLLLEQQAIFDNASVGIMFTKARIFQSCNRYASQMFGYEHNELIGKPGITIYPSAESYAEVGRQATPPLSAGKPFTIELELKRKDGSLFWCRLHGKAVDPEHTDQGTIWISEDITQRRRAEHKLRQTLMEMEAIMMNASVGILFVHNGKIMRSNRRFAEMFGCGPDGARDRSVTHLFRSREEFAAIRQAALAQLRAGKPVQTELNMRRADGTAFWAQLIGYTLNSADTSAGTVWIIEDRSSHRAAEESLRAAVLENDAILQNVVVGIAFTEQRRILRCNRKLEELFGYGPGELNNQSTRLWYLSDEDFDGIGARAYDDLAAGRDHSREQQFVRRDGSVFWGRLTGRAIRAAAPLGKSVWLLEDVTRRHLAQDALMRARDELEKRVQERTAELAGANAQLQAEIAERRHAEEQVRHMAHHDALTGLPNRTLLKDRLEQAIALARRNDRHVAVMFLDLDRFKAINDTLGHHVGDALLTQVARRLREATRASDTVARLGGDEFVVVLPDVAECEDAVPVAEKLIDALTPALHVDNHELHITPSIGVCLFPRDGGDVDTLMKNADTAMYQAKASGRNNCQFFTEQMNAVASHHFQLESSLRRAIGSDEFQLHFQPIMDLHTQRLCAMEVLLRWQHPAEGLLAPGSFIGIAEETGLIVRLGEWVLREACRQNKAWLARGLPVVPLAVNLSPRQFRQKDLFCTIRRILEETGLPASLLEVEITESTLMHQGEQTVLTLERLKAMGVALSIDDFGTGYSSLAYLKRFAVEKLKIDRSFVKDLTSNTDDHAIVTAVTALARGLGLTVIAEGVETAGQVDILRGLGCRYAQGYLFSHPAPGPEAERILIGAAAS